MSIHVRIFGDFGFNEFDFEYDENTTFDEIELLDKPTYNDLHQMELGLLNINRYYSMYFDSQDTYLPIGGWMEIKKYIDFTGGEMRSQKRYGPVNGVLDITLRRRINSKINDLF
jgi:hypothetical protein